METAIRKAHFEKQFQWYEIECWEKSDDLFGWPHVILRYGRIGQPGTEREIPFERLSDAYRYFDLKVRERLYDGYTQVDATRQRLDVPDCVLCGLVRTPQHHDTFVCEFPRSVLFISWDQMYPGRSMLVFKTHVPDFFTMTPSELLSIVPEVRSCEVALANAFGSTMMNYLFMGNTAMHVHLHLVPRSTDDPNFGSSPFLDTARVRGPQLPAEEYRQLAKRVQVELQESVE